MIAIVYIFIVAFAMAVGFEGGYRRARSKSLAAIEAWLEDWNYGSEIGETVRCALVNLGAEIAGDDAERWVASVDPDEPDDEKTQTMSLQGDSDARDLYDGTYRMKADQPTADAQPDAEQGGPASDEPPMLEGEVLRWSPAHPRGEPWRAIDRGGIEWFYRGTWYKSSHQSDDGRRRLAAAVVALRARFEKLTALVAAAVKYHEARDYDGSSSDLREMEITGPLVAAAEAEYERLLEAHPEVVSDARRLLLAGADTKAGTTP